MEGLADALTVAYCAEDSREEGVEGEVGVNLRRLVLSIPVSLIKDHPAAKLLAEPLTALGALAIKADDHADEVSDVFGLMLQYWERFPGLEAVAQKVLVSLPSCTDVNEVLHHCGKALDLYQDSPDIIKNIGSTLLIMGFDQQTGEVKAPHLVQRIRTNAMLMSILSNTLSSMPSIDMSDSGKGFAFLETSTPEVAEIDPLHCQRVILSCNGWATGCRIPQGSITWTYNWEVGPAEGQSELYLGICESPRVSSQGDVIFSSRCLLFNCRTGGILLHGSRIYQARDMKPTGSLRISVRGDSKKVIFQVDKKEVVEVSYGAKELYPLVYLKGLSWADKCVISGCDWRVFPPLPSPLLLKPLEVLFSSELSLTAHDPERLNIGRPRSSGRYLFSIKTTNATSCVGISGFHIWDPLRGAASSSFILQCWSSGKLRLLVSSDDSKDALVLKEEVRIPRLRLGEAVEVVATTVGQASLEIFQSGKMLWQDPNIPCGKLSNLVVTPYLCSNEGGASTGHQNDFQYLEPAAGRCKGWPMIVQCNLQGATVMDQDPFSGFCESIVLPSPFQDLALSSISTEAKSFIDSIVPVGPEAIISEGDRSETDVRMFGFSRQVLEEISATNQHALTTWSIPVLVHPDPVHRPVRTLGEGKSYARICPYFDMLSDSCVIVDICSLTIHCSSLFILHTQTHINIHGFTAVISSHPYMGLPVDQSPYMY